MNEPENIQCFRAAMRAVLLKLYRQYPMPCTLDSVEIQKELPPSCVVKQGPFRSSVNVVAATIRDLRRQDLIHTASGNATQILFPDAVLTSRGLYALSESGPDEPTGLVARLEQNLSVSDLIALTNMLLMFAARFAP